MNRRNAMNLIKIMVVTAVFTMFLFVQNSNKVSADEKVYPVNILVSQSNEEIIDLETSGLDGSPAKSREKSKERETTDSQQTDETQENDFESATDSNVVNQKDASENEENEVDQSSLEADEYFDNNENSESNTNAISHETSIPTARNRELKENEVIVNTYKELTDYLVKGGNGVYDTYYLGSDFDYTAAPSIPKNYSFVIDGRDFETGEIHTLNFTTTSSSIYPTSTTTDPTTVTIKNMKINSVSTVGAVRTLSKNTDVIIDNVDFNGAMLVQNTYGTTTYRDVNFTKIASSDALLYKGKHLKVEGILNFNNLSSNYGDAIKYPTESVTFGRDAIVNVDILSTFQTGTSTNPTNFYMLPGSNADINIMHTYKYAMSNAFNVKEFIVDDANLKLSYNSTHATPYTNIIQIQDTFTMNNSNVTIETPHANSAITTVLVGSKDLKLDILNGSELNLDVGKALSSIVATQDEAGNGLNIVDSTINANVVESSGATLNAPKTGMTIVNSKLNFDIDASRQAEIRASKKVIIDESVVYITVDATENPIIESGMEVEITESDLDMIVIGNKSTGKRYSFVDGKSVILENTRLSAYTQDAEYNSLFNVEEDLKVSGARNKTFWALGKSDYSIGLLSTESISASSNISVQFDVQQVNTSSTLIDEFTEPNYHFAREDNSLGKLHFTVDKSGNLIYAQNDFVNPKYPNPEDSLQISRNRIFVVGNLVFNEHEDTNSRTVFEATTFPNAKVDLTYNHTVKKTEFANGDGNLKIELDPKADVDFHHVKASSNYLQFESGVDYTKLGSMDLVEYPTEINFGVLAIPSKHKVFNREDTMKFTVEDSRYVRTGWKLELRLVTPLTEVSGNGRNLEDALVYRNPNEEDIQVIKSDPILIYETQEGYAEITELNLLENEGVLLELFGANGIYNNSSYDAQLEWVLTSK